LRPAIAYDDARLQDQHTDRMRAEQVERHRALTQRDHIIGLQATTKAAENRYSLMRTRTKRAERRYRELRDALDGLIGEIEQISDSRRPRTSIKGLADRLRADNRKRDRDIAKDDEG
jgi:hypothetical protein